MNAITIKFHLALWQEMNLFSVFYKTGIEKSFKPVIRSAQEADILSVMQPQKHPNSRERHGLMVERDSETRIWWAAEDLEPKRNPQEDG